MKQIFVSLIIALLCLPVFAQKKLITIEYDRFKDQTKIRGEFVRIAAIKASDVTLSLNITAGHPGKEPTAPEDLSLVFRSMSNYGFRFNAKPTLIFFVDGKRLSIDDISADSLITPGPYSEIVFAYLSLADLKLLSTATSIEGQLGSLEFKLTSEHQKFMAAMVDYFSRSH